MPICLLHILGCIEGLKTSVDGVIWGQILDFDQKMKPSGPM